MSTGRTRTALDGHALGNPSGAVKILQEAVGRQLDLLVAPLGGAVDARDERRAVHPTEVTVDERVTRLRLLVGTNREP